MEDTQKVKFNSHSSQALDTNVIKATNKDDLCDRLEELQQQLVLCEKALAEYLETKRLFFPRFYFVSSADLLDILSIGNQPKLVMKHLTKLFDSIAKLELEKNENNEISALGMYAKDGEYVPFDTSTESAMTCVTLVTAGLYLFIRFNMLFFDRLDLWKFGSTKFS